MSFEQDKKKLLEEFKKAKERGDKNITLQSVMNAAGVEPIKCNPRQYHHDKVTEGDLLYLNSFRNVAIVNGHNVSEIISIEDDGIGYYGFTHYRDGKVEYAVLETNIVVVDDREVSLSEFSVETWG